MLLVQPYHLIFKFNHSELHSFQPAHTPLFTKKYSDGEESWALSGIIRYDLHSMLLKAASACFLSGHLGVSHRSRIHVFGLLHALAKVGWDKLRKHVAPIGCSFEASFGTNSS